MRWAVTLMGEHSEGVESREAFLGMVSRFRDSLLTRGFRVDFEDWTLDVEGELPVEGIVLDEPQVTNWDPVEAHLEAPLTNAEIKAGIKRLKREIGGNRILSQAEMAEELGVTRYQIRKALGK